MAPCISDKHGGTTELKGFMRVLGVVARRFSIGMVCYTRTAINYNGYSVAFTLEESSGAL